MANKVRPRELVFGLLIFVAVIISFSSFSQSMLTQYSVDPGNRSLDVFNKTGELQGLASDLKERTETRVTGIDPLDNFIVGTFNTLDLIFSVPDILATVITDAGEALKIPGIISVIITAAISLIVAFAVIETITKGGVF